jgi:hypothetical protein
VSERSKELDSSSSSYSAAGVQIPPNATLLVEEGPTFTVIPNPPNATLLVYERVLLLL